MHIYSDVDTIELAANPTYCATNDVKYCTHSCTTKVQLNYNKYTQSD